MKYKTTETKIYDSDILEGWGVNQVARMVGCDPSYISFLKNGRRVATYEFYQRLVGVLTRG